MSQSAVMEVISGAPVLIVAFGGVRHGLGFDVPPFEFVRSLSEHNCDAIFLRDVQQAWYQFGVQGVAADVAGLARWLESRRRRYTRTVMLGNSMGGFAALLFGRLAGFDLSIAFSPQTTIEASALAALGDRRWQPLIQRIHARVPHSCHFDVLSAPPDGVAAPNRSLLFFGGGSAHDEAHAMRLADAPGAYLFAVKHSDHRTIQVLRDNGLLARLIRKASDATMELTTLVDELRADDRMTLLTNGPDGPFR